MNAVGIILVYFSLQTSRSDLQTNGNTIIGGNGMSMTIGGMPVSPSYSGPHPFSTIAVYNEGFFIFGSALIMISAALQFWVITPKD